MLCSQRPISAKDANAAAPASEAPHQQGAGGRGPDPREPFERVGERGDEPVGERTEAVEDREDEVGVLGRALVEKPALEVVEVSGQLGPDQPRRPREVVAPDRERAEHEQHHEADLRRAPAPAG
jgi:hypothetical protein